MWRIEDSRARETALLLRKSLKPEVIHTFNNGELGLIPLAVVVCIPWSDQSQTAKGPRCQSQEKLRCDSRSYIVFNDTFVSASDAYWKAESSVVIFPIHMPEFLCSAWFQNAKMQTFHFFYRAHIILNFLTWMLISRLHVSLLPLWLASD